MRLLTVCVFGFVFFTACANLKSKEDSSWKHVAVFINDQRILALKALVKNKTEPNYSAWLALKGRCDLGLLHSPSPVSRWSVPGFYDGHEAQQVAKKPLETDGTLAYEEALCFRVTDNFSYAESASKIITAWMETLKSADVSAIDSKLTMSYHFPPMIAAADLLKVDPAFGVEKKNQFKKFIREIILPLNTMETKQNNFANWGTVLVLSVAAYLDDEELFKKAEARFQKLIDIQIADDGTLPKEICRSDDNRGCKEGPHRGRNGLWYTNFTLMPTTIAAEILRVNGVNLYEYHLPHHAGLKAAFQNAAKWNFNPETFPFYDFNHGILKTQMFISYFELLNVIWPERNADQLLVKYRPLTNEMAMPDLTFTHGNLGSQSGGIDQYGVAP
jgi:hypothetical protein